SPCPRTGLYDAAHTVSKLLVHSHEPDADGCVVRVTPESAGWQYVGFEVYRLPALATIERSWPDREVCVVVLSGRVHLRAGQAEWPDRGIRQTVFAGPPTALYIPPGTAWSVEAADQAEVAVCTAPAERGADLRLLAPDGVRHESRGTDGEAREIAHIL